jgi:hypothetical protein
MFFFLNKLSLKAKVVQEPSFFENSWTYLFVQVNHQLFFLYFFRVKISKKNYFIIITREKCGLIDGGWGMHTKEKVSFLFVF